MIVLCANEEAQFQTLDHTSPIQPIQPMLPGAACRLTQGYVRHGTSSFYAALDRVASA